MQPQLSNSCCFSGHRPDSFPGASPEGRRLRALLREMVRSKLGKAHFYCGMARGADIWFAETVLALATEQPSWASASIPWCLSPGRRGNREPPIIPAITPFCGSPNRRGIFLPDTPSPVTICETGQWWTPAAIFFLFSTEARAERRKPMRMPCRNRGSGWYMIRKPGGCIPGPTRNPSHPFFTHFLYRKSAYPHFET